MVLTLKGRVTDSETPGSNVSRTISALSAVNLLVFSPGFLPSEDAGVA